MTDQEKVDQVIGQIIPLVDARIDARLDAAAKVLLGTAITEFERLYMKGLSDNEPVRPSLIRKLLRWLQATLPYTNTPN